MKEQTILNKKTYGSPLLDVTDFRAVDILCTSGEKEIGVEWDSAWDA